MKITGHIIHVLTVMLGILLAGCSATDGPANLEPIMEMLPATDVTRTEASLSIRILNRGQSPLSYVRFHYRPEGGSDLVIDADDPTSGLICARLTGLHPGTLYTCYAEGGTATASLRTEDVTFSTEPNALPALTAARPLSTGPTGIILEFDITDTGGEPILDAGCYVTDGSGNRVKHILDIDPIIPATYRMAISSLSVNSQYLITPFASNSAGETTAEPLPYSTPDAAQLHQPGMLAELLGNHIDLQTLTIAGDLNGDDFRYLRLLLGAPSLPEQTVVESSNLTDINLSDVNIVEGGATFDGSRPTVANEISTGLFADCTQLRHIELPASAIVLARDAFARCTSLLDITVSAGISSVLPSAGCPALSAINVSPANQSYRAADGVLFNFSVTEIIWFPQGKTGSFTIPSTITAIGENAFYGTSITSLEIPSSVTVISRGAFAGTSLTEITLPDNLTNISEGMFQNCTSLTTLHLGCNTDFIGNYAFDGTSLTDLYIAATEPPYAAPQAFANKSSTITEGCTLHVPAGCRTIYRSHSRWKAFNRIIEY